MHRATHCWSRTIYIKYNSHSSSVFVGHFLIKWIVSLYSMFMWWILSEKNRFLPNKTAFQCKNLISMKACTTFCIFYCRPCNLWNVCTREPMQNIRERATWCTHKKCEMQNTKTFDWMVRAFSIARTIGAGRAILFSELVVASYACYICLYVYNSFLIHLPMHLSI